MPNLERDAVVGWLRELRPETVFVEWPPAVRPIETESSVSSQLTALGETLDQFDQSDLQALARSLQTNPLRDDLTAVLAQLGAARMLRLMHWMAETGMPEVHTVIGALVQADTPAANALRAAADGVTRRALIRRMFAPERISALEAACETLMELD
jgi:hypothetical protein